MNITQDILNKIEKEILDLRKVRKPAGQRGNKKGLGNLLYFYHNNALDLSLEVVRKYKQQ